MTQFLPPNLLALFAPRDAIPYLPPVAKLPHEKNNPGYTGVAQFMTDFEDPKETPAPTRSETKDEKKDRLRREKAEQILYKLEQDLALWDPHANVSLTEDAFKTLFVSRINYDTSESKLRREFEVYGPIKSIRMIHDVDTSKPRGYAFIEYEQERDMHSAYKHADGKKIDGRRVLVDVERARTVKGWRPRRLGGGLGSSRKSRDEESKDDATGPARRERSRSRERRRKSRSPVRRRSRSRERKRSKERDTERRRSRSRERKRVRRSRSRDRRRSRSKDRKRSRRSRSKERRRDDVKIKTEKLDDGFPPVSDNGVGAPIMAEGEAQRLTEYPAPEAIKTEDQLANGDN
ncbi:U1 small nuclear ribonucleoprotein 70 kDa-like [Watersipora subatra]|uniref:U1 small nuclear ribonucleoprotein 70 kDa-like n=1 Tax=Watersipora subatra TaxID=2589382 RepID=UPI00355BCBD8